MTTTELAQRIVCCPKRTAAALPVLPLVKTSGRPTAGSSIRRLFILGMLLSTALLAQSPTQTKPPVSAGEVDQTPAEPAPVAPPAPVAAPAAAAVPAQIASIAAIGTKFDKLDGICNTWNIGCPTAGDTIDRDAGGFRTKLAKEHLGVIGLSQTTFGYNFSQPPHNPQVLNFQKPNWYQITFLSSTYNVPSTKIQVVVAGVITRANFSGLLGATVFRPLEAYVYQKFFDGRFSYIAGYTTNNNYMFGGDLAGSTASGSLGVNAVIPYEVGMSFTPFPAPSVILKYTAKNGIYAIATVQRSLDPEGNVVGKQRDRLGFRFDPHGDEALYIPEVGFKRAAAPNRKESWFRATGFYNQTGFTNYKTLQTATTGPKEHNNAISGVFEQQLTQPDQSLPYRGIYVSATAQHAAPDVTLFQQYYQVAFYSIGLVRKRPLDLIILNLNRAQFSRTVLNTYQKLPVTAQTGIPTYDDSTTVSGTYAYHVAPGIDLTTLVSYTRHPTFAPKLPNPVLGVVSLAFFF
jgi:porin